MPTYEYKCPSCGKTEVLIKSVEDRDEAPACTCNEIGEGLVWHIPMERVISPVPGVVDTPAVRKGRA